MLNGMATVVAFTLIDFTVGSCYFVGLLFLPYLEIFVFILQVFRLFEICFAFLNWPETTCDFLSLLIFNPRCFVSRCARGFYVTRFFRSSSRRFLVWNSV